MNAAAIALAFAGGVTLAQQYAALPSWPLQALLAVSGGLLFGLKHRLKGALLLGLVWACAFGAWRLHDALPGELEGRDLWLTGVVADLPERFPDGLRFAFHVEDARWEEKEARVPRHIRLSWYDAPAAPRAGERWRLRVRLKRPHGTLNPGGFDYEGWLFAQGVRATGYVRPEGGSRLDAELAAYAGQRARQFLAERLDAALSKAAHPELIKALVMGEDSAIRPEQWEVLRRTGTTHLMVISGSHIGLLAGWVFWLTQRLCARLGLKRRPPPLLAAWSAALAAFGYAALADFAIPARRALLMAAVALAAVGLRRTLRPLHVWAIALGAVSLHDPLATVSPGFWLSFLAVGLILFVTLGRRGQGGFWRGLWHGNRATALGLIPLLVLFFQQAPLIAPLANLLAIPLLGGIAVPLALLATLAWLMGLDPHGWLLHVTDLWLAVNWTLLENLSALPLPEWHPPAPDLSSVALALIGALLLLAPRGIPARGMGMILLLPFLATPSPRPEAGAFRLTLLDVDQGLSAVVETASRVLVFDTGARWTPRMNMGQAVVAPFLRQAGWTEIDTLLVSHGDNDHIGGAPFLLQSFPVPRLLTSVPHRLADAGPAKHCLAGQNWEWDGVHFAMLSPATPSERDENDQSCVLRVSGAGGSVLLTGDIEALAEQRLVEVYGDRLASDALVVPHHGSATSSTPAFLHRVRPRWALIPAGYRNRYRHPSPEILRRYHERGIPTFSSAASGAIRLEFRAAGQPAAPERYRLQHRRYWNLTGSESRNR
ncbi:MAG TPA: DNA internalization-related competence protein ComEC/Rec2 [Methylococcaceae bacterium]|nr:DNA internalization-related competence protein ComEC/Rec2 [Methylococcaceae bacterium]